MPDHLARYAWENAAQEYAGYEITANSFQEFSELISKHSPIAVTVQTKLTHDDFKVPVRMSNLLSFTLPNGKKAAYHDRYNDQKGQPITIKGLKGPDLNDRMDSFRLSAMNRTIALQLQHPNTHVAYKDGHGPTKTPEEFADQRKAFLKRGITPLYS